jgi:type I restriction enzyme R subunit
LNGGNERVNKMTLTENQIEQNLINKLVDLKYKYRSDIHDKATLYQNFRQKFAALNKVELTDSEFERLLGEIISPDVFIAAKTLRERNTFMREDGTPLQYTLVNIKDWCKNDFEVINQLKINTDNSHHRYDVILLINGIPVVQIELKTLGINPRRAMEQIVAYKNTPGNGYNNTLLCFMQLFIVSNRDNTYYFANNHNRHFAFNAEERFLPIYQLAGEDNRKISNLYDFADKFLVKCTLGELISRYMVLVACEQKLMIMRPYQIYAVKAIVDCIKQNRGNGYIWHTTGSGKTLTSFKASTLLKDNHDIEKCLFVVDRKDLDRQTRLEFNKFQEGCVEENTNTETLVKRLLSDNYADKVIVTTIQKLGLALDENNTDYRERLEPLRNKRMVFIFDECHRSQFGENHKAIKNFFPKAQLFGFTGTPIFEANATQIQNNSISGSFLTTESIFEKQLHAYTITHAIDDRNVLRFHIDYFKPENSNPEEIRIIQRAIVETVLTKHDAATNNRRFNAIMATSSINDAIEYYKLFKSVQKSKKSKDSSFNPLNVVCVFSPPAANNRDVMQLQEDLPQEKMDNMQEPEKKKKALEAIIHDYNLQYGTNHSINNFDLYYQDVQQRIKYQQYPNSDYPRENKIDIVIVVDMLLTGFDSKYLNTLYVDKKLSYHSLVQAFSRTNRVLNDTKPYGNILDFRQQQGAVDEAIALFSGEGKTGCAREIWLVDPAPEVIKKFDGAMKNLEDFMTSQGLPCVPEEVNNLKGNAAKIEFINRFKEIQRLKTQLDQYTDLNEEQQEEIEEIIPEEQLCGFRIMYLEIARQLKDLRDKCKDESDEAMDYEPGDTSEDQNYEEADIQQLDFEFVLFSSAIIDYDYIMKLISQYVSKSEPDKQEMSREQLIGLLSSNSNLMDEREDIIDYINSLKVGDGLSEKDIHEGYQNFKEQKYTNELIVQAQKSGLEANALQVFVDGIMYNMRFDGERLTDLMTSLNLGWKERRQRELLLMEGLIPILKKKAQGREIAGLEAYE